MNYISKYVLRSFFLLLMTLSSFQYSEAQGTVTTGAKIIQTEQIGGYKTDSGLWAPQRISKWGLFPNDTNAFIYFNPSTKFFYGLGKGFDRFLQLGDTAFIKTLVGGGGTYTGSLPIAVTGTNITADTTNSIYGLVTKAYFNNHTSALIIAGRGLGGTTTFYVDSTVVGYISNANIWTGANQFNTTVKINGQTAGTVPYLDVSKNLVSSIVTPTELGFVSGVTSGIQTQLNSKISGNQTITFNATGGDVTGSTTGTTSLTPTLVLINSGVTAGTYTNANITIDAKGRVTTAANGSAGVSYVFSTGLTNSGNTIFNDLSTGKAGSQTVIGGTASSETLTLTSTQNVAKGKILFGALSAYDEAITALGIGTISPITKAVVVDTASTDPRGISDMQFSTDANAPQFNMFKRRGLTGNTAIVTGDRLGRIKFYGYDGSTDNLSAEIRVTSTGTIGSARVPSTLGFYTSTNAAPSVETLALTLGSDQSAAFAGALSAGNSSQFSVSSIGNLTINNTGTTTILTGATTGYQLGQQEIYSNVNTTLWNNLYGGIGNNSTGATIGYLKTRSTTSTGNTIVQNGDGIFDIMGLVTNGTNNSGVAGLHIFNAAEFRAIVDGTPSSTSNPGRFEWLTTAVGSTSPVKNMSLDNAGLFGLTNIVGTYKNIATAGIGIVPIYGLDARTGLTSADGSTTTIYTTPNGTSRYRITADIDATAFTSGTATYTITYTQNGTSGTLIVTSSILNTITSSNTVIHPDNGTTITTQLTGTFVGTFEVTGFIEQIK